MSIFPAGYLNSHKDDADDADDAIDIYVFRRQPLKNKISSREGESCLCITH